MGLWEVIDRTFVATLGRADNLVRAIVSLANIAPAVDGAIPFTPLTKELSECTVALITTCGIHLPSQERFNMESRRGDPTYREFDWSEIRQGYMISHSHYNNSSVLDDINVALPGDRMNALAQRGIIKALHPVVYSFMGFILDTRPLTSKFAPEVAGKLAEDGVDIALITPC